MWKIFEQGHILSTIGDALHGKVPYIQQDSRLPNSCVFSKMFTTLWWFMFVDQCCDCKCKWHVNGCV
jgi:hypothetical protein